MSVGVSETAVSQFAPRVVEALTEQQPSPLIQPDSDWAFVLDNWRTLLFGTVVTVSLTLSSIVVGFLLGLPVGTLEAYGDGWTYAVVSATGVVLRATPIVVLIVLFFFGLPIPRQLGEIPGLGVQLNAFLASTLALGLRSAAYQSQVFRGTIQSVSEGQLEAARSIGLSSRAAVLYVVLPQALRRSVPGFQNEFTIVLKDTSVVFAIGLADLLRRGFQLFTRPDRSGAIVEVILAISLIYFVLTFLTNRALDALDSYYAVPDGEGTA